MPEILSSNFALVVNQVALNPSLAYAAPTSSVYLSATDPINCGSSRTHTAARICTVKLPLMQQDRPRYRRGDLLMLHNLLKKKNYT
jgi:hypothetical protein